MNFVTHIFRQIFFLFNNQIFCFYHKTRFLDQWRYFQIRNINQMSSHCFLNTCAEKCCNVLGLCPSLVPLSEYKDCYYYYDQNEIGQHSHIGSSVLDWVLIITVCLVIIAVAVSLFKHCRKQEGETSHNNQHNAFGQRDINGEWKPKENSVSNYAVTYRNSDPSNMLGGTDRTRNVQHQAIVHYQGHMNSGLREKKNQGYRNPYYRYEDFNDKVSEKSERSAKRSLMSYYNKKFEDYGTHANPKMAEVQSNSEYNGNGYRIAYNEHLQEPKKIYHRKESHEYSNKVYHGNDEKMYHENDKVYHGNLKETCHEEIEYPKIYH